MTTSSATPAFLDTNIWLYAFIAGQDTVKNQKAVTLIATTTTIFVSTQVINEVCTNMLRKQNSSEQDIRDFIDDFYTMYNVIELNQAQLLQASVLREKYLLSYWDGLIVASALYSSAPTLYSEDMHDSLVIEQRLQIVNPFK